MTVATPVLCPHCSAEAAAGAEFCGNCGMALPSAAPTGPRVVDARNNPATTSAGMKLRADELLATAKRAARSLLGVGIVNLAFAALLGFRISQNPILLHVPFYVALASSMGVAGAIYVGLYFLANVFPLTATITGLIVYLIKWAVDIGINQLLPTKPGSAGETNNYYFIRILMVVYLIRGIIAAVRHRELQRQQAAGTAPLQVLAAE